MTDDARHMARAMRLASLGRHASPNPMVGCVIVGQGGRVVGEGFHVRPAQPHAEINALAEAGADARGATAYVTLEPCSHTGRTPPCADALIRAGIARVVVAMEDPDSRVSGRGIDRLRNAGITVEVGQCELEARALNAAYITHRTTGLPYLIVKAAMTLDGKIATATGDSRWITAPVTRAWTHRAFRDRVDAIMVGVGTVLSDDPSLTTRIGAREGRNPLRIIVDTNLRTPPDSRAISPDNQPSHTIIACGVGADKSRRNILEASGVQIVECIRQDDGKTDLSDLMHRLGTRGDITSVLMEGGGSLIGSAFRARLVDRYVAAIAMKLVGGFSAPGPLGGPALAEKMGDAVKVDRWTMRRSGPDIVIDTILKKV